jgi:hypothetical protein
MVLTLKDSLSDGYRSLGLEAIFNPLLHLQITYVRVRCNIAMTKTALLHDQLGFNSFMQMIMIMPFD